MLPLSDGAPARRFPAVNVSLITANFGLFSSSANGGGVAFFAHVGGFIFGWWPHGSLPEPGESRPG